MNQTTEMILRMHNNTEEIGGIKFLMKNLAIYLPYITLTSIGTVIGVLGNLLIIAAILLTKELKKITNLLIFNLAVSDLMIAAVSNSFSTIGVLVGKQYFVESTILCHFIAILCVTTCICSIISMTLLAFNRYILICCNALYKKIFSKKLTIAYLTFSWLAGMIVNILSTIYFGWEFDAYDEKVLSCHWNRLLNQIYNIVIIIVSIILPCLLMFYFYTATFVYAFKMKTKSLTMSKSKELQFSLRIAKGLFGSYILFAICWLPYTAGIMLDFEDQWSREYYVYSMTIMILNSSLNPIFYGLTNPAFQKGYLNVLNIILCREAVNKAKRSLSKFNSRNTHRTKV